jgi:hypothetical protein
MGPPTAPAPLSAIFGGPAFEQSSQQPGSTAIDASIFGLSSASNMEQPTSFSAGIGTVDTTFSVFGFSAPPLPAAQAMEVNYYDLIYVI